MLLKKIKVYHLFWIVALLIGIIGILQNNNPQASLDINIHDTYFVMRNTDTTIFLFVCYFSIGLGYWLLQKVFKKQLVLFLTLIHSIILIGSFILYWILFFYNQKFNDPTFPLYGNYWSINTILLLEFLLILFVATPVFLINLLIGIFRKNKI
jgi:heme/copper-type cytochrome/quinol oxidase subunit 1